ncbi:MAG: hypothetical protein ACTSU2_13690 [Promethearchaeota archaeon]
MRANKTKKIKSNQERQKSSKIPNFLKQLLDDKIKDNNKIISLRSSRKVIKKELSPNMVLLSTFGRGVDIDAQMIFKKKTSNIEMRSFYSSGTAFDGIFKETLWPHFNVAIEAKSDFFYNLFIKKFEQVAVPEHVSLEELKEMVEDEVETKVYSSISLDLKEIMKGLKKLKNPLIEERIQSALDLYTKGDSDFPIIVKIFSVPLDDPIRELKQFLTPSAIERRFETDQIFALFTYSYLYDLDKATNNGESESIIPENYTPIAEDDPIIEKYPQLKYNRWVFHFILMDAGILEELEGLEEMDDEKEDIIAERKAKLILKEIEDNSLKIEKEIGYPENYKLGLTDTQLKWHS